MTSKFKTSCSCGEPLLILGSKKGAYCPQCDRAPEADAMEDYGKYLEDYGKAMDRVFKILDDIFSPVKQCQGGCGKSYPEEIMHSGIWCSECYETKEETN